MRSARTSGFRCVVHGSFGKHFPAILQAMHVFQEARIQVVAPRETKIVGAKDGFALLSGEEGMDPRIVEILYLSDVKGLGPQGFSYFCNPGGYIGKSASFELAVAWLLNVPCYFLEPLQDHPAYVPENAIWSPEDLAKYISRRGKLPPLKARRGEQSLHDRWEDLVFPERSLLPAELLSIAENPDEPSRAFFS